MGVIYVDKAQKMTIDGVVFHSCTIFLCSNILTLKFNKSIQRRFKTIEVIDKCKRD